MNIPTVCQWPEAAGRQHKLQAKLIRAPASVFTIWGLHKWNYINLSGRKLENLAKQQYIYTTSVKKEAQAGGKWEQCR